MSDKGSVFQKGGGGTDFEQLVQTAFLTTLITKCGVPCIDSGELTEIALQVTNRGYETDDFMATVNSIQGNHRLLFQVKHDISFTSKNEQFKEVVTDFWKDFNNTSIFDKSKDKLIIVKNGLTKNERAHFKTLFNWAKSHDSEIDFISEVNRIKIKKNSLDIFRKILKEANNNIDLTDKQLWEFLKCVDVLEYDLLNNGSVDKTYFLNLIKLSKNNETSISEDEIWNSLFSYISRLNPNGGSINLQNIKSESFFNYFDNARLQPCIKDVEKLKSDSKEILRPLKTYIGKNENILNFPRTEVLEQIVENINNSQITIISGKPGVGKSAAIKALLNKNFHNASVFVFRADQFNTPTLANLFSNLGIHETIESIFSCISLIPEKIIYIDSLEKLLETDPECSFKQMLALLKEHPKIKLIASSREYAIDLIAQKFGIDKNETNITEIPTLNDDELNLVKEKFPQLISVIDNKKLNELLQCPKYLDFSILAISKTNDSYANLSLTEFKNKLWNSLVVDQTNTRNGLPLKREEAFMDIAIKRAKKMKLFVRPDKFDAEAITCLENDEIIFQENNNNRKYSPTHDILEDWALVKYISSTYDEFPNPQDLFNKIGNEPAIRRAFRLWVEDYLIDNNDQIIDLINSTIFDTNIEKYWSDELLIAIFKSETSHSFFIQFEKELLDNKAELFTRCLHLLKTCCKENFQINKGNSFLLPIGSGWKESIFFIQNHLSTLDIIKHSILNFISEYNYRIISQYNKINNDEKKAIKFIVLTYLNEIEDEKDFLKIDNQKEKFKVLMQILFNLAEISKEEITSLIQRSFKYIDNDNLWELNYFYTNIIENSLAGVGNFNLINELPEIIIETAWKYWKFIPQKKEELTVHGWGFPKNNSLEGDECWGIKHLPSFSPSGIYKTPFYTLLNYHPMIGVKFIIEFINYAVDFYVNSDCEYKHNISIIELTLNDGSVSKLWGSPQLWGAYRGISVTSYLLESLLMSLEKFLLEIIIIKTDKVKEFIKYIFDYVYKHSNNIAPIAVLSSITMAYPEEVEESMLPLLSIKEAYVWDISRVVQESAALSPSKERWESNQLPHRKKYKRGLSDFIFYYQLNNKKLKKDIHKCFDKINKQIKKENLDMRKLLQDIDIRNLQVKEYDEKLGGFPLETKYEDDINKYVEINKVDIESINTSASYSNLISKAYENKEKINFEEWNECYSYYLDSNNIEPIYSRPATLAFLGLQEFPNLILEEQKEWCIDTLVKVNIAILDDTFSRNYNKNNKYSILDKSIALTSFHLILQNLQEEKEISEILEIIFDMLIAPFSENDTKTLLIYIRETFFKLFPSESKKIWFCLIKFSQFKKENPKSYGYQTEESIAEEKRKEKEFIQKILYTDTIKLDLSEINFKNFDAYLLTKVLIITPYNVENIDYSNFINNMLSLVISDLFIEEKYTYPHSKESRNLQYSAIALIENYLSSFLLLNSNVEFSKKILTQLVNSISNDSSNNDFVEFVKGILDYIAIKLYDNSNLNIDQLNFNKQKENFWTLWELLNTLLPTNDKHPLIPTLFLDIRFLLWSNNGNPLKYEWCVLNSKKTFYKNLVLERGKNNTASIINVFSTIGEKEFLPEGISWLKILLESNLQEAISLSSYSAERMIKRLYYNHIGKIKNNNKLINDYIWILNLMVDLGSSSAYLIRENVITYKKIE